MMVLSSNWQALQKSADLARQGADHEKAVALYTQALAQPDIPWEQQFAVRMSRAFCQKMLGQTSLVDAELSALAEQAREHEDSARQSMALSELAFLQRNSGDLIRGVQLAQEAMRTAELSGIPEQKAEAALTMGILQAERGEYDAAWDYLALAQPDIEPGNLNARLRTLFLKSLLYGFLGKSQDNFQTAAQGLQLARESGERDWEGVFLNIQAISVTDLSRRQSCYEQGLAAFEATGNLPYQAVILGNMSGNWIDLGLYPLAIENVQRALRMAQAMGQDTLAIYHYQFLGLAYTMIGDRQAGIASLKSALELARKNNHIVMQYILNLYLCLGWMFQGQAENALDVLKAARELGWQPPANIMANMVAYQAGANCLAGNFSAARQDARQAFSMLIEKVDQNNRDVFLEEMYWWCYRACISRPDQPLDRQMWRALDQGVKALFIPVQDMSDAGLRRGFLHRVSFRRLLIREWLRYGAGQGVGPEELLAFVNQVQRPGRLSDVFRRLLSVGVRLNVQRDPSRLPDAVVEEVAELTGAERIALALFDALGNRRIAAVLLPLPISIEISGRTEYLPDRAIFEAEVEPWLEEAAQTRRGFVRQINPDGPLLDQRSMLVAPLVSQGRLVGLIYADLTGCFGRFEPDDLELLGVLANQSAVAIENAEWAATLENKVAERTGDAERSAVELKQANKGLAQRNNELAVINTISEAMSRQLDVDAIVMTVGDLVRAMFKVDVTNIALLDQQENLIHLPYSFDHTYVCVDPFPFGRGLTSKVLSTRQPLLLKSLAEILGEEAILTPSSPGDEEMPQSYLGVPIIVGEQVIGVVDVQSYAPNAFTENEARLLSTIASSMGVALENARLFTETQRLLEESRRRMGELAMLSEVGRALSSTLQVDALLQLIYEQTSRVLYAENMYIALYDPSIEEVEFVYSHNVEEVKPGTRRSARVGMTGYILHSHKPVFIHGNVEEVERELGLEIIGPPAAAWLGVPMLLGNRVLGVISVQHYSDPNAYDETHLMLLQAIAGQAAVALENARLYVDVDRRAGQMAILAEAGREITASRNLTSVMENITRRAHDVCRARTTVLRLVDADGQSYRTSVALGMYAEQFMSDVIHSGEGITGSVIASGIPEIIPNPLADPRTIHLRGTPEVEEQPETMMIAPLVLRDQTVGVLTLYRWAATGQFTNVDLDFLSGLARQAAIAIENVRLLETAQESQRQMADIIDFLPDATLVIDREGKVIAWNRAIEAMTGIRAADMLGRGAHEYALPFYGERRPILIDLVLLPNEEVEKKYVNIERSGAVLIGETFVPLLQGKPAYLYAAASALRDAKGEIAGAIETIRDISDRKLAEEELRQAKIEAETARQVAEAANQAKSAFLATMSHEIRTPMNAIIGMSGLLLNTKLDEQQQEFAEIIRTSGDALLAIINDILDFSKIEAGKLDLESTAFDLRECLESAIDLLATPAAEKKLDLALEVEPNVPSAIVGDVTRLRQVLINLLNNAVKFTEHGEVVLTVGLAEGEQQQEEKCALHFTVRDTGIGIPADRLDRLFQSFSQVDSSTARRYGGTGLGLAISKRLAEMMGGRMWVESEVGKGSTFHFTIQAEASHLDVRTRFYGTQPRLAGRRLLIVDDNPTNRRIIHMQSHDWGMITRDTGSPMEALEWIRQGDPFDLAILDMHMPGMDGISFAHQLRELPGGKELPLVMLSSVGAQDVLHREPDAASVNWSAFLTKPIKQSQLFNVLAGLFGKEDVQAVGRPSIKPATPDAQGTDQLAIRCPLSILLVEDNAFNHKLAVHLLAQLGYRADLAANGLEAIQSVERQQYDVILMDVQMPEMDGLEASRQICVRWPREPRTGQAFRPRIIAMTANAMQGDREMCLAAGMDDYISKPIRLAELAAVLERAAYFISDIQKTLQEGE